MRSIRKGTGLVHIYCGDGKGKTTTGMGLCVRAAGFGYKVMIYQFMKDNRTSERKVLAKVDNITLIDGLELEKFTFRMTEEEKRERRAFYDSQLDMVTQRAVGEDVDVLFLDEAVYAVGLGMLDEEKLIRFLQNKPDKLEVILTGRDPSEALQAEADYISEIRKIKHPFAYKQGARDGIER